LQAGSSRGAVVVLGVVGSASAPPVCGAVVVVLGVVALGTVVRPRLTGGVGAGVAVTVGADAVVVGGGAVVVSGTVVVVAVDVVRGGSRAFSSSPPPQAARPPAVARSARLQAVVLKRTPP